MNAFTTHPSVRIKGTENNYEPVQCMAPQCPNKTPHMHCPFCTKTESFVDPVILKAHYRVKHVDKGIEFAGLKVLRCCDHCDIVGTIKGVKEFKGAHWHCYKCKNGFNRRDEAIKHYRTHFRNPQTTFQIQITQEINQMYPLGHEVETATESLTQDIATIHPALTEAVMTHTATEILQPAVPHQETVTTNGTRQSDGEVHVSVAANETVDTSEGQTIMIIQEDSNIDATHDQVTQENCTFQIAAPTEIQVQSVDGDKSDLEQKVYELQQRNEQLEIEKTQLEHEVDQFKIQVQMQGQEISGYQKREQDLLAQLSIPLDERIHELLNQLKADHEDLLHQQLAMLRKSYLGQLQQQESGDLTQEDIIIVAAPTGATGEQADADATLSLAVSGSTQGATVTTQQSDPLVTSSETTIVTRTAADHSDISEQNAHHEVSTQQLVENGVTVTLSSEQFSELEASEVVTNQSNIVIADEIVEPPEKRKKSA